MKSQKLKLIPTNTQKTQMVMTTSNSWWHALSQTVSWKSLPLLLNVDTLLRRTKFKSGLLKMAAAHFAKWGQVQRVSNQTISLNKSLQSIWKTGNNRERRIRKIKKFKQK